VQDDTTAYSTSLIQAFLPKQEHWSPKCFTNLQPNGTFAN